MSIIPGFEKILHKMMDKEVSPYGYDWYLVLSPPSSREPTPEPVMDEEMEEMIEEPYTLWFPCDATYRDVLTAIANIPELEVRDFDGLEFTDYDTAYAVMSC